jgi:transposase
MNKAKTLDFTGHTIFCAVDAHKRSWRIINRDKDFELEDYSQDPCAENLYKHLKSRYPGAHYKIAYEAGFCGFEIQRALSKYEDVECIVVNAADVPTSDKEKKRKTDKIDARKISRELSKGELKGIYIPDPAMEHARSLVRQRTRIVQDQTRCKNRIWHLLMFSGLKLDVDKPKQYWSKRFIESLRKLPATEDGLKQALEMAVDEYLAIRELLKKAIKYIRQLSVQNSFEPVQRILQTIPGIGLINAMIVHTEVMEMKRFKTLDALCSDVGIVPDTEDSGDTKKEKGITHRCNHYLRPAIVESSWSIIRKDPAMLMKYKQYCQHMPENKAIIKIAKHLLSRIRYVWLQQKQYVIGVV